MAIVDRLILRLAVYEFLHASDIPKKVVINEALELARTFSADEAVGFVNGILDGIKRQLEKDDE
jgi:N utilization substance protein B